VIFLTDSSGFVTFDTVEAADEAVSQFNNTMVGDSLLEVEMARRQGGSHHHKFVDTKVNVGSEAVVDSLIAFL